jgi:hypothetical protein
MAVSDVNWKWLKKWLLRAFRRARKIFFTSMIGFAGDFALLETEDRKSSWWSQPQGKSLKTYRGVTEL